MAASSLSALSPGQHLCSLYRRSEEQLKIAVPFFRSGLEKDECCLYIADDQPAETVKAMLRAAGLPVDGRTGHDHVRVVTKSDTYLRYGRFEPTLMIWVLETLFEEMRRAGYRGVRVMAEMTWALEIGCQELIPYEARINDYYPEWPLTGICQYNMQRFSATILEDVLRTHPIVLLDGQLYKNATHYQPSSVVLQEHSDGERLTWMLDTLKNSPQV